jgi:hypothetical protein
VLGSCDGEGTPAYLEATISRNRSLYERPGSDVQAEVPGGRRRRRGVVVQPHRRRRTAQALEAGHRVTAVTRQPDAFPLHHAQLDLVADVLDAAAVDAAPADHDVVLSRGAANIIAAMSRQRARRLIVVSSSGVDPRPYSDAGLLFNRLTGAARSPLVEAVGEEGRPVGG